MSHENKALLFIFALVTGAYIVLKKYIGVGGQGHTGAYSAQVVRIAQAIAFAEGFQVVGSVPASRHNPGDITNTLGVIIQYPSDDEGWDALYALVVKMLDNIGNMRGDMTIGEIARVYTATEQDAWASNVAGYLGVDADTLLSEA